MVSKETLLQSLRYCDQGPPLMTALSYPLVPATKLYMQAQCLLLLLFKSQIFSLRASVELQVYDKKVENLYQ